MVQIQKEKVYRLSPIILLSALIFLVFPPNAYSQNITTPEQMQAALEYLQNSQEGLMEALVNLENNNKEIERLGIQAQVVAPGYRDEVYAAQAIFRAKIPELLKNVEAKKKIAKKAIDNYTATIKWATDLRALAERT